MITIKSTYEWIKPRWLKLAIGFILLIYAFKVEDNLIGFIGSLFILQGIRGKACCGNSCN